MTLKNFEAASRKRNMVSFGMFPASRDLTWITDNPFSDTPVTVAYTTTPVFDLANGNVQRITLTGNVTSSTFVLNGGSSIPDATMFYLQIIQDATGERTFALPASVRNSSGLALTGPASTQLTVMFQYRSNGWDIFAVPVEGPSA